MAREKKHDHKVQMTEGKRNIIHQLLEEYDILSAEDIQDALKDQWIYCSFLKTFTWMKNQGAFHVRIMVLW